MPQDKKSPSNELFGLLLDRNAPAPNIGVGPTPYKEIPWQDEDPLTRFMGAFTGTDGPGGGVAGMLGMAAGVANPLDDITRYIRGVKGIGRMAEFAPVDDPRSISKYRLPQVEEAFQNSGKHIPEVSSEMGRLIGEMIDDKHIRAGWKEFASRNPEATGHIRELTIGPDPYERPMGKVKEFLLGDDGAHYSSYPVPTVAEKEWAGTIHVNPNTLGHVLPAKRAETIAHELQHHAQQMIEGSKQFYTNYRTLANRFGYHKNPYETEAKEVGKDVMKKVKLNKLSGR